MSLASFDYSSLWAVYQEAEAWPEDHCEVYREFLEEDAEAVLVPDGVFCYPGEEEAHVAPGSTNRLASWHLVNGESLHQGSVKKLVQRK